MTLFNMYVCSTVCWVTRAEQRQTGKRKQYSFFLWTSVDVSEWVCVCVWGGGGVRAPPTLPVCFTIDNPFRRAVCLRMPHVSCRYVSGMQICNTSPFASLTNCMLSPRITARLSTDMPKGSVWWQLREEKAYLGSLGKTLFINQKWHCRCVVGKMA